MSTIDGGQHRHTIFAPLFSQGESIFLALSMYMHPSEADLYILQVHTSKPVDPYDEGAAHTIDVWVVYNPGLSDVADA